MTNPENVTPYKWKKGQSGNPEGKKPGTKNTKTILMEILEKNIDYTDPFSKIRERKTIKEVLGLKLVSLAISGNISAIKDVLDRVDGIYKNLRVEGNLNLDSRAVSKSDLMDRIDQLDKILKSKKGKRETDKI